MVLLVVTALAGPIFTGAGAPAEIDVSGSWVRVFAAEGGWHVVHSGGGNFHYAWLPDSLVVDRTSRRELTSHTNLLDHALALCPDGSYLHFASATLTTADDTLYSFRYDANFQPMYASAVHEASANAADMDPPAVCTSWLQAVGHMDELPRVAMRLETVDEPLSVTSSVELEAAPEAPGSVLYADDTHLWAVGSLDASWSTMHVSEYDTALKLAASYDVNPAPAGSRAYWFQRMEKVGDVFIVAHMMRTDADEWATQNGNIYLSAFDEHWTLVDQLQVTDIAPPTGAFYAWFDRKGDTLLVSYHADTPTAHNEVRTVTLDLDACGLGPPVDTGEPHDTGIDTGDTSEPIDTSDTSALVDTSEPADTGTADTAMDTGAGAAERPGCGCDTSASGAGLVGGPALFALIRRRRRP